MALKKLKGLKVGRLIVLILLIAIPAFFFILIDAFHFLTWEQYYNVMPWIGEGWSKFFVWFCAPVFFSMPWVIFLFIDKDRIGETFDNMGRALRKVSVGLNIFYGVNALFIFTFFILPFGSPAIAVLAAFSLVPWLIRSRTGVRVPFWIAIIPGILLAIIPVFLAVGFYWNYGPIWSSIWNSWIGGATTGNLIQTEGWVYILYGFGYSLAIGAVVAGFISFIYEGASQVDRYQEQPAGLVYIVEFLVAAGIFLLYMLIDPNAASRRTIFLIISIVSVSLGAIEFLLRWIKNLRRQKDEKVPISAYIILPLFIAVDFIRTGKVDFFREYSLTIALALACVIYFILFIMAYSFAGETYQSPWSQDKGGDITEEDVDIEEE
ncbi:MAG: hypothetical protein GF308_17215 [Candidatus Heimdallarchaeota archaeon]|nr:hypothetical protein [Candidatus Heimdallarchaeota archaeon]